MICTLTILLVVSFVTAQGTVCKSNLDCGAGECCYIPSPFLVVSRRRVVDVVGLPLEPLDLSHQNGTCERYRTLGENCYALEKMNGHCGCSPELYCKFYPLNIHTLEPVVLNPQLPVASRRSMLPGYSKCQPSNTL